MRQLSTLFFTLISIGALATSASTQNQPMHDAHSGMNTRGDHVMGFSHEKTTHHFHLYTDGGSIEVQAKDPQDTSTRDAIQMHLSHIARMFADGNFRAPMLIHDQVPPGVPTLQRLKSAISYRFEKTATGGRVAIRTTDPEALNAVYEFLRFQITDHQTGDSPAVVGSPQS